MMTGQLAIIRSQQGYQLRTNMKEAGGDTNNADDDADDASGDVNSEAGEAVEE